jgi:hypothetical protein
MSDAARDKQYNRSSTMNKPSISKKQTLRRIEEEDDNNSIDSNKSDRFSTPFKLKTGEVEKDKDSVITPDISKKNVSSFHSNFEISNFSKSRNTMRRMNSIYNGRPRSEKAIDRIIDPFYTCDKTIIRHDVQVTKDGSK